MAAAAAAAGPPAASASASSSVSYQPAPYEQSYYLGLFRAADVAGQGQIGGTDAVQFMTRSQLPMDVLKQIWTVANPPSASSSTSNSNNLDPKKFAIVVRLIQLTQNGQKGHGPTLQVSPTTATTAAPLRPVFFEGVSGVTVPWPASGLPPPATAGGHPPGQQQPHSVPLQPPPQSPLRSRNPSPPPPPQQFQLQQQPPMSAPSRALVGMDPYAMSPQERARYEQLFPQYATKHVSSTDRTFVSLCD